MGWGKYMKKIGDRVKALRLSKRLSQAALAKRCELSQPTIANIERGRTLEVKGYVAEALARELDSTVQFILQGSSSPGGHEEAMLTAEILSIFGKLDSADKEALIRMARGLLANKVSQT